MFLLCSLLGSTATAGYRKEKKGKKGKEKVANHTNDKHEAEEETPLTLEIDIEHYQTYLDDMDIPDEKKRELVEIIYSIVVQFVELGFGITTTDQALDAKNKTGAYSLPPKPNSPINLDSDTIKALVKEEEDV